MNKKNYIIIICSLLLTTGFCNNIQAQQQKGYLMQYLIENGDTVYFEVLKPVYVFPVPEQNTKSWKEYRKLVYNFKKVYPFALAAKDRMDKMDAELAQMPKSKDRDKLIDKYEKELFRDFEKPLKKLSFSQGKLLLKLIDREVGQTSYYVIKDLKGSFKAFFWQGFAKLFGADLKKPYDKYGEDKEVEKLVKMYKEGSFDMLCYQLGL